MILSTIVFVTWLLGHASFIFPVLLWKRINDPNLGLAWFALCGGAFTAGGLTWLSNRMRDDPFNAFYHDWMIFPFSAMFLMALLLSSYQFGKAGSTVGPLWLRVMVFVSFLFLIPIGFGGVAEAIDGTRGTDSIIQYSFEFYWHLLDMISVGAVSIFAADEYAQNVMFTASGSLSVFVFNICVGVFVLSWIAPLLKLSRRKILAP